MIPPRRCRCSGLGFLYDAGRFGVDFMMSSYPQLSNSPMWDLPSWMKGSVANPLDVFAAPSNLVQPILPGWAFGSVTTVTEQNSTARTTPPASRLHPARLARTTGERPSSPGKEHQGMGPRKLGSHRTRRWREPDSNLRFLARLISLAKIRGSRRTEPR